MERQIKDQDIKPLIKLTLLTLTPIDIRISIPFFKKFAPEVALKHNEPILVPLFHALVLNAGDYYAQIDLQPLLQFLNERHIITMQTYSKEAVSQPGPRYSLNLEFAQTVVWDNQPNFMKLSMKRLGMVPNKSISSLQIKVVTSNSYSWKSNLMKMQDSIILEEEVALAYQSLLDNVYFQLWSGTQKLCQLKKYVFELIDGGIKLIDLIGPSLKAQLKFIPKNEMPIIPIQ